MSRPTSPKISSAGFTLVELAIGLVVIGIIISSLITPVSTLRENAKLKDTEQALADIHDAVLGFAINNAGRLPCPATSSSNGLELYTGSVCSNAHGFVPVSSLGLVGRIDTDNLLLDPWGQPYRYSAQIGATYQICNISDCPSAASIVATSIPAVIFSTGSDGTSTSSADQLENLDGDNQFVHTSARVGSAAYNDQLHWISPNILKLYLSR